jgi:hypothetical protein
MSAAPPPRDYDQILSGDIKIKKVSNDDYTHKITFSKKNISKVLMYQVWSDTSVNLNKDRIVKEVKATSWVKSAFRKVETGTVPSIPFTPTTVMELDDGECPYHHKAKNCNEKDECRHVFVIKRALVNKCGQVVFYVSSKDIVLPSNPNKEVKRLKTIPTGSFYRARFDIDAVSKTVEPICENGDSLYSSFLKKYNTYKKVNDLIDVQFSGYNINSTFIQLTDNYLKKTKTPDVYLYFIPLNKEYQNAKYVTPTPNEKKNFCDEDEDGEESDSEIECCIHKFVEEDIILTPANILNDNDDDYNNLFDNYVSNGKKYDGTNYRIFVLIRIPSDNTYYYQYIDPNLISLKTCFQFSSIFNIYNNDTPTPWNTFLNEQPSIDKDNNKIILNFINKYLDSIVEIWFLEKNVDINDIKFEYCDDDYKKKAIYNNNPTTFIHQIRQSISKVMIDTNGYTGVKGDIQMYVRLATPVQINYIGSFYV